MIKETFLNMQIIYEDENIIVCHKPAGLATQSADMRSKDVVSLVKTHLVRQARKNKVRLSGEPYVGLIHRLDQPVEGILVLAKDKESAAKLSKQVTDNKIEKHYFAVVEGNPDDTKEHICKKVSEDGTVYIEDEIIKNTEGNAQIVTGLSDDDISAKLSDSESKKTSKLEYKVIATKDGRSKLDIHLITGRFHQIRATLAYLGCPIVGDARYGAEEKLQNGTIALCSYRLQFTHPVTHETMNFVIEPEDSTFQI